MIQKSILSICMLLALGVGLWTTMLAFKRETIRLTSDANLPDSFMDDVIATVMDKQGKLKMKIVTPRMVHFNENDTAKLTQPYITLYRNSVWPWFITAKNADVLHGIETVNFWENVIIHQPGDQFNSETIIKTTSLTVFPNKQVAITKDFITLDQNRLNLTAIGMNANMDQGDIQLLSEVKGEYASQS